MEDQRDLRQQAAQQSAKQLRMDKYVYKYFAHSSYDDVFNKKGLKIVQAGETSLQFKPTKDNDKFKTLEQAFNIILPSKCAPKKNHSLFRTRFLEAAYGKGNELREITQLNSSALVALMCFYPVNDLNPIKITLVADGTNHTLSLTELHLEKENPVYTPNRPSSIDIALYGKDVSSGDNVVLFLESKFGEYFNHKNYRAGKSYKEFYSEIVNIQSEQNLRMDINFKADESGVEVNGPTHYCEGIKQMISHYIGSEKSYELNQENRTIYLGTILFDFSSLAPYSKNSLEDYKTCYKGLARILNSIANNHKKDIRLIDDAFTYQEFFSKVGEFKLDEDVKEFYKL